jgi:hypothetical protein
MSEPQNPVAAAVASELKSLRTRAGLREDRLTGTELALDTLRGLDSVRELMAAGEPAEQAIIRAVRAAASDLDPTLSIVADASLGLELSAGLIDDGDLYARDLGLRRGALLRNWDQLHQLRSVSPGRPPSARALRLDVEAEALGALAVALTGPGGHAAVHPGAAADGGDATAQPGLHAQPPPPGSEELQAFGAELRKTLASRGLTAQKVARQLKVPESVLAGWIDGSDLPSEADARSLDERLTARGAILTLALELRTPPVRVGGATAGTGQATTRSAGEPAGTLGEVFHRVAAALRGTLIKADDGTPLGWPQDLRQLSERPPTIGSTAYGLRTMLLLEGDLAPDMVPVVESLRKMAAKRGVLALRQADPPPPPETLAQLPPELIGLVTDTFHRVDGMAAYAAQVTAMRGLGEFEKSRPFILTTMLEASLRLQGTDELTSLLIESLLAARRPYGTQLLWPEKSEPLLIDPAPSLAHTARAVRVLARLQQSSPDELRPADERLRDAVEQGKAWLLEQREFPISSDAVDRLVGDQVQFDYTRHFTAAWVVKALISAGVPATHPTVSTAVSQVWDSYAGDTAALWKWRNGDLPVWMTFDAIDALRLASQAVPARPGW